MTTNLTPTEEAAAQRKEEMNLALSKAKIQLMSKPNSVFFTTLCFSLRQRFDDGVPTAYTDGKNIVFGSTFFMGLDYEERVFLLLHETMHCAYLHMDKVRMAGRCPDRWNIACDHVINLQLIERGFKMPACGLADIKFKDMSAEEVYKLLPDNPGKPQMPDLQPGTGDDEELRSEIQDALMRASIQSKMAGDKPGTIPGEIEIFLKKLLSPKLPWWRILQKYLSNFAKSDYSFRKPGRRHFPQFHLPSMYSESLMNLAVAVDTSGSVSDSDFLAMVSEVHSILRMMKPEKISFIQFDTQIKSVEEITDVMDLMKVKFFGRGGTDITPVQEWARANKPQLLLIFTDGGFRFHRSDCNTETIWLIHNNASFTAPFGKVIHYTLESK